jgi:hypothetical protein
MKHMTRVRAGYLATLAAGVAIGFGAFGTASAAPAAASATSAGTTKTFHYSLASTAFAPDGLHNTAEDYFNQWDPATLSNTNSGRCFNAGLSLPPNATLKSITVYYTAGSTVMYFEINQQTLATHGATSLVSFDTPVSTSGPPTYTSMTVPFPANTVVKMAQNAYSAGVCPANDTTFSGFNITYTVPA